MIANGCQGLLLILWHFELVRGGEAEAMETMSRILGDPLQLDCPTTDETKFVSWWRTGADLVPRKISNQSQFSIDRADHSHSGMYECFDSYGDDGEFKLHKWNVLIIEYTCRRHSNVTTFEIVRSKSPEVNLSIRPGCIVQNEAEERAWPEAAVTFEDGQKKVVTVDLPRSDGCENDTSIMIGGAIQATCRVGNPEKLLLSIKTPDSVGADETIRTWALVKATHVIKADGETYSRALLIVIPILLCCALLTVLSLLAVCHLKNRKKRRGKTDGGEKEIDIEEEPHYDKIKVEDFNFRPYDVLNFYELPEEQNPHHHHHQGT